MATREDWQKRLGPLYGGAVALVHSTPWRWPTELTDDTTRSAGWVVATGLPVGFAAWLVAAVVKAVGIPVPIAALFGLAMLSLASAAIVERGLVQRIERWQGTTTLATLVMVFATLIRGAAIIYVPPSDWLLVFLATAVVGRWAAVFLQALGEPIDADEGRSLVTVPPPLWLAGALSIGVGTLAVLTLGKAGVLVIALGALAAFALGLEAQKRDQGLSAPVVAVAATIGELLVLLVATTLHHPGQ